jgi:hypothetical protein
VYDASRYFGAYSLTRSYGRANKHDISVGFEVDRRKFRPRNTEGFDEVAVRDFVESELPVSDTRVSPFVQLRSYATRYHRVLDFETLGLQEDFRLGHEAIVRFYPATTEFASSRDMLGTRNGAAEPAQRHAATRIRSHRVRRRRRQSLPKLLERTIGDRW